LFVRKLLFLEYSHLQVDDENLGILVFKNYRFAEYTSDQLSTINSLELVFFYYSMMSHM